LLWLLTDRVQLYYLVSSVLATEAAILCNFALNHTWTFRVSRNGQSVVARLLRFNIVSVGGLALTVLTLFLLKQFAGLNLLFANVLAVGFASVWNYLANRRWTWPVSPAAGS
ncbi:MAG: GtrA family protein, partial [Chloroflexi bacterium]|nr:GtrA family protein [Chloroflexota bacterium]